MAGAITRCKTTWDPLDYFALVNKTALELGVGMRESNISMIVLADSKRLLFSSFLCPKCLFRESPLACVLSACYENQPVVDLKSCLEEVIHHIELFVAVGCGGCGQKVAAV